jgi:hypothetical protein
MLCVGVAGCSCGPVELDDEAPSDPNKLTAVRSFCYNALVAGSGTGLPEVDDRDDDDDDDGGYDRGGYDWGGYDRGGY